MRYQGELSFLRDVYEKSHLHTEELSVKSAREYLEAKPGIGSLETFFSKMRDGRVYGICDSLKCRYLFFLLPGAEKDTVLTVGPFLSAGIGEAERLEIAEKNKLSLKEQRYLGEYYLSLPILTEESHLMIMLRSFCEKIWHSPVFEISEIDAAPYAEDAPMSKSMPDMEEDTFINVSAMENRYAAENEMMRAVELGLSQTEFPFGKIESVGFFENRTADPLRNAKNYGIIMNTLLRKAAEKGGLHPIQLDRISTDFALRLEKSASVSESTALMLEMFRSYCRLVRKHRLKGYSITVQKIILSIDADISENLSSGTLAKKHGISVGYLSTVFKKETGKTVSEYIRDRRMEYARYLLGSTKLQIQTVAFNSGIMDVQYFSKIFKKHFGQTPSEFRTSAQKQT